MDNIIENLSLDEKITKIGIIQKKLGEIIGLDHTKEYIIKSFLNNEHILIEGHPGNGKTEIVNKFAESLSANIKRIQGTTDLMPQDIIGYVGKDGKFIKGPIFTNILIVDEINRIPSKSLSGLISAMAEGKIIDDCGNIIHLPKFFMVVATQNPLDNAGIYELPEAIKDRFGVKLNVTKGKNILKKIYLSKLLSDNIIPDKVMEKIEYIFDNLDPRFSKITEIKEHIEVGPSIRAGLQFIEYIKTNAYLDNRKLVTMDDVYREIIPVFQDKIVLKFNSKSDNISILNTFIEKIK